MVYRLIQMVYPILLKNIFFAYDSFKVIIMSIYEEGEKHTLELGILFSKCTI